VGRLRHASKAPLAVAGIIATPLFFVALMAFSLRYDKPSVQTTKKGAEVLGDPTKGTVATIYLLSLGICALVVLAGLVAMLLPRVVSVFLPTLVGIGITLALLSPLGTWENEHTSRYPLGIDLIPKSDPGDLSLRGEWEDNAHHTANQIGFWTIVIAVIAIAFTVALELRRRRRPAPPVVPPPPEVPAGGPVT
jgi:hypothetical protein